MGLATYDATIAKAEADLPRVKAETETLSRKIAELAALAEESLDDIEDGDGIPEETFDDPSVVREVRGLQQVAARVRRSSSAPPPFRLAKGTPAANAPPTQASDRRRARTQR